MRHLFLTLLLVLTGLFATDWTPPGLIPITSATTVRATTSVPVSSIYRQFTQFQIPATVATVKASATPIKSTRQVWAHGIVSYFHGFPVASNSGTLSPGEHAGVDALYQGDQEYLDAYAAKYPGYPLMWAAEFQNVYKARWEASYDAANNAIIFTLRIEDFVGIDPLPYPAEHKDGALVPLPVNG
jgi:hypothetical protein